MRNLVFAVVGLGVLIGGIVLYESGSRQGAVAQAVAGGVLFAVCMGIWLVARRDRR